ncbi:hypothetical protein SAMN05216383_101276 [Prevotella sp. KH2C16]|nr:hypothetical protein SAMN05216383_101276 [Prevotella sp. KH2C16]
MLLSTAKVRLISDFSKYSEAIYQPRGIKNRSGGGHKGATCRPGTFLPANQKAADSATKSARLNDKIAENMGQNRRFCHPPDGKQKSRKTNPPAFPYK